MDIINRTVMAFIATLVLASAAHAQLTPPTGPVIITVVGDITHTNRGAFDPEIDKFFDFYQQEFNQAAAFDRMMLEDLGLETREFIMDGMTGLQELEGPTLEAVLNAVGAEPQTVAIMALDGYQAEIDSDTLSAHDWILGINRNGEPLSIGGFGPVWAVFSPAAEDKLASEEEAQLWPYAAFVVRVGG